MDIKTNTKYNFSEAESDLFSWSHYDGTNGNILTHKPSGKQIYQMHWCNERGQMTDKVEGEVCQAAGEFWKELARLQEQKPPRVETDYDTDPEPTHGKNGYCRKCHSYCYGDCEA